MKKAVIQDITDALGISRTSVWKALNNKEGISERLKQQIINKARELNYPFVDNLRESGEDEGNGSQINVAVAVCRPETSIFWTSIIHHISIALASKNANLIYVSLPYSPSEEYALPKNLQDSSIDGLIILNVYNAHLIRLLNALSIPKVFFDTSASFSTSELTGDLVMMENINSMTFLTEHLISGGREKIGFIGDVRYAKTNLERYESFCRVLDTHGLALNPLWKMTGPIGADTHKEEIADFLEHISEWPDAFVCANDYIGCIVLQLLSERNIDVPSAVAVTGFDDNLENPFAEKLSTAHVYNADIGCKLAYQIMFRIGHPDNQYEIIYIATSPILRESSDVNIVGA